MVIGLLAFDSMKMANNRRQTKHSDFYKIILLVKVLDRKIFSITKYAKIVFEIKKEQKHKEQSGTFIITIIYHHSAWNFK